MKFLRVTMTVIIWLTALVLFVASAAGVWSWRESRGLATVKKFRVSRLGDQYTRVEFWALRDEKLLFVHRQNFTNPPLPPQYQRLLPTGKYGSRLVNLNFDRPFPPAPEQIIFNHAGLLIWHMHSDKPISPGVSDRVLFQFPSIYSVLLALPLAALVTFRVAKVIRNRRRRESNCCINCGYDLRGSEGACPECGSPRPT